MPKVIAYAGGLPTAHDQKDIEFLVKFPLAREYGWDPRHYEGKRKTARRIFYEIERDADPDVRVSVG